MKNLVLLLCGTLVIANALVTLPLTRKSVSSLSRTAEFLADSSGDLPINDPLVGSGVSYFLEIDIGTPPQTYQLIADTGSSFMALIGENCENVTIQPGVQTCTGPSNGPCVEKDSPYNPAASSTYQNVSCNSGVHNWTCDDNCYQSNCAIDLFYGDGSCGTGWIVSDFTAINGSDFLNTTSYFGVLISEGGRFSQNDTDGILGLAYSNLSQGFPTFIDQLALSLDDPEYNVFSMCLGDNPTMTFGGYSTTLAGGSFSYTPITDESYYVVDMVSGGVKGAEQYDAPSQVIVDSGTTLIVLPVDFYENIVEDLIDAGNINLGTLITDGAVCSLTNSPVSFHGPDLEWTFTDARSGDTFVLTTPLSAYVKEIDVPGESYCYMFGIQPAEMDIAIMGDVFMSQYYVVFDRNNKEVGFAPSGCNNGGLPRTLIIALSVAGGAVVLLIIGAAIFFKKRSSNKGYQSIN